MGRSRAAWAISMSDGTVPLKACLPVKGVAKREERSGSSAPPASLSALRYSFSKYAHRIRRRDPGQLVELEPPHLGQPAGHLDHPRRLVPLAAIRRRREVG